jgi:hypothetical protein
VAADAAEREGPRFAACCASAVEALFAIVDVAAGNGGNASAETDSALVVAMELRQFAARITDVLTDIMLSPRAGRAVSKCMSALHAMAAVERLAAASAATIMRVVAAAATAGDTLAMMQPMTPAQHAALVLAAWLSSGPALAAPALGAVHATDPNAAQLLRKLEKLHTCWTGAQLDIAFGGAHGDGTAALALLRTKNEAKDAEVAAAASASVNTWVYFGAGDLDQLERRTPRERSLLRRRLLARTALMLTAHHDPVSWRSAVQGCMLAPVTVFEPGRLKVALASTRCFGGGWLGNLHLGVTTHFGTGRGSVVRTEAEATDISVALTTAAARNILMRLHQHDGAGVCGDANPTQLLVREDGTAGGCAMLEEWWATRARRSTSASEMPTRLCAAASSLTWHFKLVAVEPGGVTQPSLVCDVAESLRAAGAAGDIVRAALAGAAPGASSAPAPVCSLPGCDATSCAGTTFVPTPLRLCSQCRRARYCSSEHQRSHWKAHKKECAAAAARQ